MGPLDLDWFLIFEFSSIGYVKDDEKDALDADAMLEALKEGNDQTNEERKKRGWTEVTLVGWEIKPRYNVLTKNLEWATRASSDSGVSINKNTRYLGRRGVMELTLVSDPKTFGQADAAAAEILKGFRFNTENEYAAFRKGDKIAEIGLTALVTGGAAAAALKMGFFKKFWKFLVIGAVAVAAAVKRILFGKKDPQSSRA
jgi:uncharacterized membrane-anchored protein